MNHTKNILLVRHGEAIGNYGGTIIGWTDSPLTIRGIKKYKKINYFY